MSQQLNHLFYLWLRSMKTPASESFLKQRLPSHPDYPSLLSITYTLDDFGINNGAFSGEREKLNESPVPFLARTGIRGGEVELLTNIERHLRKSPEFKKNWDGIAMVAEKPGQVNKADKGIRRQEKSRDRNMNNSIFSHQNK